jgi:hypothetical protein
MKTTNLTLAILVAAGLAAAPFAAEAKSHKKHQSSATSQTTTGANMKSTGGSAGSPSSQGNAGPGTNQGGSMAPPGNSK